MEYYAKKTAFIYIKPFKYVFLCMFLFNRNYYFSKNSFSVFTSVGDIRNSSVIGPEISNYLY